MTLNRRIQDLRNNLTDREFLHHFLRKLLATIPKNHPPASDIHLLLIELIQDHANNEVSEIIQAYKNNEADLVCSNGEITALWAALTTRQNEIIAKLLEILRQPRYVYYKESELTIKDSNLNKLLHLGVYSHTVLNDLFATFSREDMHYLMDSVNKDWNTPLHLACINVNIKTVALLINNGAIFTTPNKQQKMPLDLILSYEPRDLLAVFKQLNFNYQKFFIEEILRHSETVLNSEQLRRNYMLVLREFETTYPHLTSLLIASPDHSERVSDKIKILDLLYSETQFDKILNKIQENKISINQLQPYNLGYRIGAILLNFIFICLLVGFVAPFSLLMRDADRQEKQYKKEIAYIHAQLDAHNITWDQYWDIYWALDGKIYDLDMHIGDLSIGVILPAILFGIAILLTTLAIIPAWVEKARYAPAKVITFYDELDLLLTKLASNRNVVTDENLNRLTQFKNDKTVKTVSDHNWHLNNITNTIHGIKTRCYYKGFALFKLPRVAEQPEKNAKVSLLPG